jgi:hypothetical protein
VLDQSIRLHHTYGILELVQAGNLSNDRLCWGTSLQLEYGRNLRTPNLPILIAQGGD